MGVATGDSLNQSMEQAVKRYPMLFRLPSTRTVLLLLPLFCIGGGLLSTLILFPTVETLLVGLLFGFTLFLTSLTADYVSNALIFKRDTILDFRRTVAFSLFCWGLWFFFTFVGATLATVLGLQVWVRSCLLGFSTVMIFRSIVLSSVTSMGYKRLIAGSFLQPFFCVAPFVIFWTGIGYSFTFYFPLFFLFSPVVALVTALGFVYLLNSVGKQLLGLQSLSIFKAFMLNWVLGMNVPFEELLERLGEERNVDVSLIKFESSKPKAFVAVPSVHPGPFKNVGSSLLPSLLKADLEEKLHCVACVPHGLMGHEYDLASQIQTQKLIADVDASLGGFKFPETKASPFIKVNNGLATACCQIFGKSVFLSFTLAPKTIEDLPPELGIFVNQEAEKQGLEVCAVVNAHNSIDGNAGMEECLASLKDVAVKCLEKTASMKQLPFEVGVATFLPKEFSLEDGMGAGGITVVVTKSGQQKAAYVVIDGNNMISGLREKILAALNSIGIDDGEILTTDTHSVSALIVSGHGYHPIGEAIENEKLVAYVKQVTLNALTNLENVRVSCRRMTVPNVKVIGAKQLETLCTLVERVIQRAKRTVIPLFLASGLLLMLFLLFV
jgi:putative membrane protein